MHYYLENRHDGYRAYHITTGTRKVQCRYGVIGKNIRLAPAIDLKGKPAEDVAKDIRWKKLSTSGGYDLIQKSPFSLDQLDPDVVSFKMDTANFPELYRRLKEIGSWENVDSFQTMDVCGAFTVAMDGERNRLQIGRARDHTDRLIDVFSPVVSSAGQGHDVLYLHRADSRAPYFAALTMAGFAEVLWYPPDDKDWDKYGPTQLSGRANSAYQGLCDKVQSMKDSRPLLEALGLVARPPREIYAVWRSPLITSAVSHRALLM